MVNTEVLKSFRRENFFQKWIPERRKKDQSWEEKWATKWRSYIEKHLELAEDEKTFPRYTTASETTWNGYYYTVMFCNEVGIVFIDRDREHGNAERNAIVVQGPLIFALETQSPTEKHVFRNPHAWELVTYPSERKRLIEGGYRSLSTARLFDHNGTISWKGYFPDPENILKVLPDLKSG